MTAPQRSKTSKAPYWIAGVILLAVLGWGAGPGGWFRADAATKLRGQRVQRGALEMSVVQRGNLAARDSVSVKSELEGSTTVLFLVKEGSFVKEGDLLVELDGSQIVEKQLQQEIAVQNADAAYTKAKAQYDIQDSQNKSDIEAAERKLNFANIDLNKYTKGDLAQQQEQAEQRILLAQQELAQAENTYKWSHDLNEKGFLTKSELERDELSRNRADVDLKQAVRAKEILVVYEDPRKQAELAANVKEAERGLERAVLKAKAQIADVDANLKSSEAKLKLEREKLDKYNDQLAKTKIHAANSGMVVYTRMEGGGRMGGDQPMQEGSQVRERQEILQIPREGGMIVEASVHESVLKQVAVGLPCSIKVDSQPGKQFLGKVTFVALLPDKGSWWANPNQRLYKTEIQIERPAPGSEEALKELRPGMSCAIEIFSERVEDALYVPLQSVFVDKGVSIAFVARGDAHERRELKVGRANEKFVQVLEGLREGEEVLLSAPPGFSPSGAEQDENEAASREFRAATQAGGPNNGPGGPGGPGGAGAELPAMPGANGPNGAGASDGEGAPRNAGSGMRPGGGRRDGNGPRREGGGRPRGDGAVGEKPPGDKPAVEAPIGNPKPENSGKGDGQQR